MKISIITPSFNQERFIERTIKSVLSQQGDFELEYIIIDGKSTDHSVDVIQRYAQQDARVRWVSESDQGQSDAINKGLRMATGDVLAYLNSDDTYAPGALARVADFFRTHPDVQWVYGKCNMIDERDREIRQAITAYKNFFLRRYRYATLLILNYISQPATFWRRQILDEIGYFTVEHHLVMDYDYWLRIGERYAAGVIPAYLASFRSYSANKSSSNFRKQMAEDYRVALEHMHGRWWIRVLHYLHQRCIILCNTVFRSI